jgi:3-oxoacyl-[acyl-carrier protein] reductase
VDSRGVLVTGSSRGIGREIAKIFAGGGDRVAIHHRDSPREAEEVRSALDGDGHAVVQGDIADPEAVAAFVSAAIDALDGIDVLVNNAAVYLFHDPLTVDYASWQRIWRRTVDVDLLGAANVSWCVARHMVERGRGGRIVNVASRGAYRGEPEAPGYAAAKAGLTTMGQSLAIALAPHRIAVSSVAPGFVETDMAASILTEENRAGVEAQSPFGRIAQPQEVAAAVRYLASAEAEFVSGTVLDLNGASYLR